MNHYPAFLRPYGKSSNNETDENSSIKSLIFKHLSKAQQATLNTNNTKGTMRGILGEVGNVSLANKSVNSMITKPKIIQQSVTTIIETKSIVNVPAAVPPPPLPPPLPRPLSSSSIVHKMEEINLNDDESITKLTKVPPEFDCDSGDSHNITTVSEYVVDICKYWRELELRTPIRQNFLLNRNEGKTNRILSIGTFRLYFRHGFTSKSSRTDRLALSSARSFQTSFRYISYDNPTYRSLFTIS